METMTQGGYPPGMGQADHDRHFGDTEPEVDEDAAYNEYRESEEWYDEAVDDLDVMEVEPVTDGEDDWRDAA
jgi:hypothetical protein